MSWDNINHVQLPKRLHLNLLVSWQATFKIGMIRQRKSVCLCDREYFKNFRYINIKLRFVISFKKLLLYSLTNS